MTYSLGALSRSRSSPPSCSTCVGRCGSLQFPFLAGAKGVYSICIYIVYVYIYIYIHIYTHTRHDILSPYHIMLSFSLIITSY